MKNEEEICSKLADTVTQYAWGELQGKETRQVEKHIKLCPRCNETVVLVQKLRALGSKVREDTQRPGEPCPDSALLVDLEAGETDEQTAQHLRAHLIHCKECREEYLMLQRFSNNEVEKWALMSPADWVAHFEQMLKGDLTRAERKRLENSLKMWKKLAMTPGEWNPRHLEMDAKLLKMVTRHSPEMPGFIDFLFAQARERK